LNYKIQKQIHIESCLNFKGVQTFWKKSHKFQKNSIFTWSPRI
jgi:hypothetical protein